MISALGGTGAFGSTLVTPSQMGLIYSAKTIPDALMNAATDGWDLACRTVGKCLAGDVIDREVGRMVCDESSPATYTGPKLFTYVRCNAAPTRGWLTQNCLGHIDAASVRMLDAVDNIPELEEIGQAAARVQVQARHLEAFLPRAV